MTDWEKIFATYKTNKKYLNYTGKYFKSRKISVTQFKKWKKSIIRKFKSGKTIWPTSV